MGNLTFFPIISMYILCSCSGHKTYKQPQKLQTEYQTNPIGLDVATPRLSWYVNDASRGAKQTAYRVIVSSNLKKLKKNVGDVWDSKKVESDRSLLVGYTGPALESRKIYFWKVILN